ncbi:MAG: hypothetical protein ACT4O6_02165 [Reyranella sp.]
MNAPLRTRAPAPRMALDYGFLRRTFFGIGMLLLLISPFSRDPLELAVGGFVPWLTISIVAKPTMPAAVVYIFLWQWAQTFARVLQSMIDGESLGAGPFGSGVVHAYWYMLASLVALACVFRAMLGGIPVPTPEDENAHREWRPMDLFLLYCGTLVLAVACTYASRLIPGLSQQFEAVSRLKIVAEFLLFVSVLSTGRGGNFLLATVLFEILIGFSGLLSDFRGVFVYLLIAAIAARLPLRMASILGGVVWLTVLLSLALFWTAVKMDYREYATGGEEGQHITMPLSDRLTYLVAQAASPGNIDWGEASYALLSRFAYVDIFGSVVDYQHLAREGAPAAGQWQSAFDHVFRPRIFFPNKAALSDSDVFARLTGADPLEVIRGTTSISVGYMAENYADLGFPGMLLGIAGLGLMIAFIIRHFMRSRLPWMVRQGVVLAFVYNVAGSGVEISLPKMFGAMIMFFLVYWALAKYALPIGLRWLYARSSAAQPQQTQT